MILYMKTQAKAEWMLRPSLSLALHMFHKASLVSACTDEIINTSFIIYFIDIYCGKQLNMYCKSLEQCINFPILYDYTVERFLLIVNTNLSADLPRYLLEQIYRILTQIFGYGTPYHTCPICLTSISLPVAVSKNYGWVANF